MLIHLHTLFNTTFLVFFKIWHLLSNVRLVFKSNVQKFFKNFLQIFQAIEIDFFCNNALDVLQQNL